MIQEESSAGKPGADSKERLESLISAVNELKSRHLDAPIKWYQTHSGLPRNLFRISGYSLIVLSVSLPMLTLVKFKGSELVVALVALLIAALAGVSSFARWDSQWRGYKRAQFSLEGVQALWELKLLEARQMDDPEEAAKVVLQGAQELIEFAKTIVTAETEEFFAAVKLPQITSKT
jgi:hypothetical protein